jgi:ElaA protein
MTEKTIVLEAIQFSDLSPFDLYALLAARQEVFIVEQACPYPDCDGKDLHSVHLLARAGDRIAGGCRLVRPGVSYAEPSIGRVFTSKAFRGTGLGKLLMTRAIELVRQETPGKAIRISAQQYLERFYGELGFQTVSQPYLEDDIPHIEMLLAPAMESVLQKS